jgi:hypothetical protein
MDFDAFMRAGREIVNPIRTLETTRDNTFLTSGIMNRLRGRPTIDWEREYLGLPNVPSSLYTAEALGRRTFTEIEEMRRARQEFEDSWRTNPFIAGSPDT